MQRRGRRALLGIDPAKAQETGRPAEPNTAPRASETPPPSAAPAETGAGDMTKIQFLESELARAMASRDASKPGSQAEAAFTRRIMEFRDRLDELREVATPTKGLDAVGVLNAVRERARGLPEPVLAVMVDEWARRHRVTWRPIDGGQDSDQDAE